MGAIVGGLYAAGMGPDELEVALAETDWLSVFTDRPPRDELYFRRKQDDAEFLVRYKVHFRDGKPRLPMGVLQAQKLENLLKFYEVTQTDVTDFDKLTIPFRAVATDLETGDPVVIDHGSLATAVRADERLGALATPIVGRGAAYADIDADGDLDIAVAQSGGPPLLIRNDQALGRHWLRVKLVGTDSNRDAIGARIELRTGGSIQRRTVMPTRSYLSQVERTVTFGLGENRQVEALVIRWPRGTVQAVAAPEVDTTLVVTEPD